MIAQPLASSPDRVLVTIQSSLRPATAELPLDVEVADLLPGIVYASGHDASVEGWSLRHQDGRLVSPELTLRQCEVLRGSFLQLIEPLEWPGRIPDPDSPPIPGLVPRLANWRRLQKALSAAGPLSEFHSGVPPAELPRPRASHYPERPDGLVPGGASTFRTVDPSALSTAPSPGRLARALQVWRQSDYSWRLRQAAAQPRSGAGMLVAVTCLERGSGATTIAALLAAALSAIRRERTVIVDASLDSPRLTGRLASGQRLTADTFRLLSSRPISRGECELLLARGPETAAILPAPEAGAGGELGDGEMWSGLLAQMQRWMSTVIVDCGAGMETSAGEAAITAADLVILVSDRERPALDYTALAARSLQRRNREVVMAASHLRGGLVLWPPALSPAGCPLVSMPHNRQAAHLALSPGPLWRRLPASWQIAGSELAALVMAGHG